jgi:hypothetical protein
VPQTFYFPIKLNNTVLPKVAAFIPDDFQPVAAINLIVYFHGHIIPACNPKPEKFKDKGIEYYLDTPFFKCLRDDLNASKANAMFIAPTLSTIFGSVQHGSGPLYGDLNKNGKFDFLINEVLKGLKGSKALPADAQAGQIILSGHSAGGAPMMTILSANNALKANIAECWGFECLYFGTDPWNSWLAANPSKQFKHFRRPGEQADAIKELKGRKNFGDIPHGSDHCTLPKKYWREAIDKCGPLHPTDLVA